MNYLEIVSLSREPFSNSPDPESFYPAEPHQLCLNRLEIAIRLKRGLNIVYGPVGSGKSTLCRALFARLKASPEMRPGLLLDAEGGDVLVFVRKLLELMGDEDPGSVESAEAGIGRLESLIFDMALQKGVTPVLLLDEGQKLTPGALEVLRVLLNFETNTEKLIQIVIFAQPEFHDTVASMPNFADRVNEEIRLRPMSEEESVEMLSHRLILAGVGNPGRLFESDALREIHRLTGGHPRRMIRLAHLTLLALIMSGRKTADARLVKAQFERMRSGGEVFSATPWWKGRAVRSIVALLVAASVAAGAAWICRDELRPVARSVVKAVRAEAAALSAGWRTPAVRSGGAPSAASEPVPPVAAPGQEAGRTAEAAVVRDISDSLTRIAGTTPVPSAEVPAAEAAGDAGTASSPAAGVPEAVLLRDVPHQASAAPIPFRIVVNLLDHPTLEEAAERFYSDPEAAAALRRANPDYEGDDGRNLLALPVIEYAVPETLEKNVQLAFGVYETAQDAYDAQERLLQDAPGLESRFAMRRTSDGGMHFCLLARSSFRNASRAWGWLSGRKTPDDLEPRILPPYTKGERALVMLPGATRLSEGEARAVRLDEGRR